MKKALLICTIYVLCICLLAGCKCSHNWVDATCTEAKTCSKCAETEGEPLGHSWQEASCTAPKTCTVCGETQGKAMAHSWREANFQDPKSCQVCGSVEGEPLTPAFREYNLPINLYETKHTIGEDANGPVYALRGPFPYVTACFQNSSKKTTGQLSVQNYRIFESDETHPATPGYEWRAFDAEILFSDDNAARYGMSVKECFENYYDIVTWDDSEIDVKDSLWAGITESGSVFTVNYHGVDLPCLVYKDNPKFSNWQERTERNAAGTYTTVSECVFTASYYCCVPVGYDGVVIGFHDSSIQWEDGQYIFDLADENTLFFRMGNDPEQWWK